MNKIVLGLLVIIVIGLAGLVFSNYFQNRVYSNEFAGQVKDVNGENNVIAVEGVYVVKDRPELSNPENRLTAAVTIDNQTKIIKKRLFLPTAEEVAATGGRFDPAKLRNELVVGSLNDLRVQGASVTVKSLKNIFGRSSFIASEILYIEPVYP